MLSIRGVEFEGSRRLLHESQARYREHHERCLLLVRLAAAGARPSAATRRHHVEHESSCVSTPQYLKDWYDAAIVRVGFGCVYVKWDDDDQVKTVLQAAGKAHKDGYKNFHFVGGGDRREPMENLLRKYNGQLYNFDNIYSHSAGEREEDDPIGRLSASGQRKFAQNGDFDRFKEGMKFNTNFSEKDGRELMKMVQMFGMKNEDWEIDQRGNKDYLRELYAAGQLYKEGDIVESLVTGLAGKVHRCGANHLICVTEDNIMFKTFIHEVHALQ